MEIARIFPSEMPCSTYLLNKAGFLDDTTSKTRKIFSAILLTLTLLPTLAMGLALVLDGIYSGYQAIVNLSTTKTVPTENPLPSQAIPWRTLGKVGLAAASFGLVSYLWKTGVFTKVPTEIPVPVSGFPMGKVAASIAGLVGVAVVSKVALEKMIDSIDLSKEPFPDTATSTNFTAPTNSFATTDGRNMLNDPASQPSPTQQTQVVVSSQSSRSSASGPTFSDLEIFALLHFDQQFMKCQMPQNSPATVGPFNLTFPATPSELTMTGLDIARLSLVARSALSSNQNSSVRLNGNVVVTITREGAPLAIQYLKALVSYTVIPEWLRPSLQRSYHSRANTQIVHPGDRTQAKSPITPYLPIFNPSNMNHHSLNFRNFRISQGSFLISSIVSHIFNPQLIAGQSV